MNTPSQQSDANASSTHKHSVDEINAKYRDDRIRRSRSSTAGASSADIHVTRKALQRDEQRLNELRALAEKEKADAEFAARKAAQTEREAKLTAKKAAKRHRKKEKLAQSRKKRKRTDSQSDEQQDEESTQEEEGDDDHDNSTSE
jgi:hypothetical protein